jgi:hypothetical protein
VAGAGCRILAALLGEVSGTAACINSLALVLRPGGLLMLVGAFPDPIA